MLTATDQHLADIAELIAPQGRFGLIDDPASFDLGLFKRKSVSVHWEFMFTRALFDTADITAQHDLLNEVARLVDAGVLRTTLNETAWISTSRSRPLASGRGSSTSSRAWGSVTGRECR